MFDFFSGSSKKKRYPNPNRGGSYYQQGGGLLGISWARPCPVAAGRAMVRGTDRAIARTIPRDIRRGISRLPRDNRAIRTSSLPLRDR